MTADPGDAATEARARVQPAVEIVLSMLRAAPAATRKEVHRLLAAELQSPLSAAELRVAELGFLRSLLDRSLDATGGEIERAESGQSGADGFPICERRSYDELRPDAAPSSRHLVDQYGSWSRACRAAYSLDCDGSRRGPSKPWPTTSRGQHRECFTRDAALAAVRQCAEELRSAGLIGPPTSWQYDEWVRRSKLEAKQHGQEVRLPYARGIYLRFPKRRPGRSRWQAILETAGFEESSRNRPSLESASLSGAAMLLTGCNDAPR